MNPLHNYVDMQNKVLNEKEETKRMLNDPRFWELICEIKAMYFAVVEKTY